jgi:3-mercaptopyruvate sulfurtransferase SseA
MASLVTEPGFADVAVARAHFARRLQLETDCSDVHESTKHGADFILIDVRAPALFAAGHVPGAINIPHRLITADGWPSILKIRPASFIAPAPTATGPIKRQSGSQIWVSA